jgi:hypothetical protein
MQGAEKAKQFAPRHEKIIRYINNLISGGSQHPPIQNRAWPWQRPLFFPF